jgi:hypothetical protein
LFSTGADRYLRGLVIEAVLALELGANRFLELGDAVNCRIFRLALADRGNGGFLDVVGRIEIGLTGSESRPSAFSAIALLEMAMVAEGWMRFNASEMKPMFCRSVENCALLVRLRMTGKRHCCI